MANLSPDVIFALIGLLICQVVMFFILAVEIYRAPDPTDWIDATGESYGPESE